jgi:hypothetical protein
MGEMVEGALKSSSDWAGHKAHETRKQGGMQDLLRRLQRVGVVIWCGGAGWREVDMKMMFSKGRSFFSVEAAKIRRQR